MILEGRDADSIDGVNDGIMVDTLECEKKELQDKVDKQAAYIEKMKETCANAHQELRAMQEKYEVLSKAARGTVDVTAKITNELYLLCCDLMEHKDISPDISRAKSEADAFYGHLCSKTTEDDGSHFLQASNRYAGLHAMLILLARNSLSSSASTKSFEDSFTTNNALDPKIERELKALRRWWRLRGTAERK